MLIKNYCDHLAEELLIKASELRTSSEHLCAAYGATSSAEDTRRLWKASTLALEAFSFEKTAEAFALWTTLSLDGKKDLLLRRRPVLLDVYVPTFESDIFLNEEPVRVAA